jgi:hypothetical protein
MLGIAEIVLGVIARGAPVVITLVSAVFFG